MEPNAVTFFVPGKPEPQGSARAFVVKGKPVVTSDNPEVKSWRGVVTTAASTAMGGRPPEPDGPVTVHIVFVMPRPKSHPKTRKLPHTKKPDLDKLVRAVFDGLTAVVFRDDSQVTTVISTKHYAMEGEAPGAQVMVLLPPEKGSLLDVFAHELTGEED